MKKLSTIAANILIYGVLYAIGIALWLDLIRSGWLTPKMVWEIVRGAL